MGSEVLAPHINCHMKHHLGNNKSMGRPLPRETTPGTSSSTAHSSTTLHEMTITDAADEPALEARTDEDAVPIATIIDKETGNSRPKDSSTTQPLPSPPRILRSANVSIAPRRGILVSKSMEETQSCPPPIGEIRIPTPPQHTSISSPCSGVSLLPHSNHHHHHTVDYESLYFSVVQDHYRMKQRLVYVSEENRTLKRHLIELQRRLFTARRTSRRRSREESPTTVDEDHGGWTVPPTTHKRIKRDDSFTMSPNNVPQSVSSEETVLES